MGRRTYHSCVNLLLSTVYKEQDALRLRNFIIDTSFNCFTAHDEGNQPRGMELSLGYFYSSVGRTAQEDVRQMSK
jgi:hypothetical protein